MRYRKVTSEPLRPEGRECGSCRLCCKLMSVDEKGEAAERSDDGRAVLVLYESMPGVTKTNRRAARILQQMLRADHIDIVCVVPSATAMRHVFFKDTRTIRRAAPITHPDVVDSLRKTIDVTDPEQRARLWRGREEES